MADVELRLTADLDQATKEVAGFRREYVEMVRAVEKPLRQVDALRRTQDSAKAAAAEFYAARARVSGLQDALEKVKRPADALAKSLSEARKQASAAGAALEYQKRKVDEQKLSVQQARAAYDALKASMASGGASIVEVSGGRAALAEQVELLRRQQLALREQRAAVVSAAKGVRELEAAYDQASAPVRLVERDLRAAERALASSSREFDRQKTSVREQRAELRRAGIDTRNLAAEQERLTREMNDAVQAGRKDAAVLSMRQRAAATKQAANEQRRLAVESARNTLGVTQVRAAQQAIQTLRQQYELLRRTGGLTTQELAVAQRQLKQRVAETKRELQGLTGGFKLPGLGGGGGKAGAAAVGAAAVAAVGAGAISTARGADEVGRLDARLRLATKSQEEFNTAQIELDRIADSVQGDVADLVSLYSRLQRPLNENGFDQQAGLEVVEAVTLSLKLSGATADESAGAVRQFAQAVGSGVLRGEEFNSVIEQSDRLAGALADSLGVTTGELRQMAKDGLLTTSLIIPALQRELPKMRQELESFAPEIVAGLQRWGVEIRRYWGRQAKESGVTDYIANFINRQAKAVNNATNLIGKEEKRLTDEQGAQLKSREDQLKRHRDNVKAVRDQMLADIRGNTAQQLKALEAANAKLKSAREDQLSVEKEFRQLVSDLAGGGGDQGGGTFVDAMAAKASARQALVDKDYAKAIEEARRAGAILTELKSGGESDFGFSGFAKELQAIANEAARIQTENAKAGAVLAQAEIDRLASSAKVLENLKVSFGLDAENVEQLKRQMADLASGLAKQMIVPITVVPPAEMSAPGVPSPQVQFPALATGGLLRGPGTGTSDSILMWGSNGEFMQPVSAVQYYGKDFMEAIRQRRLPRYATGGEIGMRPMPSIPPLAPALQQQLSASGGGADQDWGSMVIDLGNGPAPIRMPRSTAEEIRRAARKFGSTRPRT